MHMQHKARSTGQSEGEEVHIHMQQKLHSTGECLGEVQASKQRKEARSPHCNVRNITRQPLQVHLSLLHYDKYMHCFTQTHLIPQINCSVGIKTYKLCGYPRRSVGKQDDFSPNTHIHTQCRDSIHTRALNTQEL